MFTHKKSVWLYLLPGLLGITVFYIVPFLGGIWYSFTDGSYKNAFVWFDNYKAVWQNEMFQLGLKNTMELSLICTPLVWVLSFIVAMLLNRIKPKGAFFRNSVLMPYLMPSSAILLIWLVAFDFGGVANRLVTALGAGRVSWLEGSALRFPIILLFVWKNLGFSVIIFLAALQSIPKPLYEYARLEGAGFFRQAFSITLPMVAPSAFLVFVMAWINAFKIFKEVYFIGGAYPDPSVYTLQNYMNNMFSKLNYQNVTTAAYSFAVLVFLLFGILFLIQRKLQKNIS
ncbi:MAG TPA: sugar ABC transporter permease [Candidatus Pullichristensenella excrementigallinarum]|uniref:Sugar ABC transporter permease n=1 Tax=Candidatus Pullichristensenella excrementigallinarum TaxID=2840907 RepID=A0A9D1IE64_9FIRM|nr:sugar ABC transporter permease [Candidatus Pullichristensenella excrementigallinarum]